MPEAVRHDRFPAATSLNGVDASPFLLDESKTPGRDHVIYYGSDGALMSVKWWSMKVVFRYSESAAAQSSSNRSRRSGTVIAGE